MRKFMALTGVFFMLIAFTAAEFVKQKPLNDRIFIIAIYKDLLNRRPTPDEMIHETEFLKKGMSRAAMVQRILNSDEFFVRTLYRDLLGREPEDTAMENNLTQLKKGTERVKIIEGIINSDEFIKKHRGIKEQ